MAQNHKRPGNLPPAGHPFSQDDIVWVLGSEILSGARKPGDRMPGDAEMFGSFGVSRVVTREVVKTLTAKGMVATRVGVGTIVQDPEHWNWFDHDVLSWRTRLGLDLDFWMQITEVRRVVEPAAASLAAQRRTKEHLKKLREAVRAMAKSEHDHQKFASADLAFHLAVSAASGNKFFISFAGVIEAALLALLSINTAATRKTHVRAAEQHGQIVDAIEAKDRDAAALAMLETIDAGYWHAKKARKKS